MDYIDFGPKFAPIINGSPLRYSVAMYRGKKRIIVAWFADETPAIAYLARCRRDNPYAEFDCLQSLF